MAFAYDKVTQAGVRSMMNDAVDSVQTIYQNHVVELDQDTKTQEYIWMGDDPEPHLLEGDPVISKWQEYAQTVKVQEWKTDFVIRRESLNDDQTGLIDRKIADMGTNFATFFDRKFIDLLTNGDTDFAFDGTSFFADNRTLGDSGTIDNQIMVTTADPDDPTPSEFRSAVNSAIAQAMGFRSNTNRPWNLSGARGVRIVCPPDYREAARVAAGAEVINQTTNVFTDENWQVDVSPYLLGNNSNSFYVHITGMATRRGVLFAKRMAQPEITVHNSPELIDQNNGLRISSYYRFKMDYMFPMNVVEVTLVNS